MNIEEIKARERETTPGPWINVTGRVIDSQNKDICYTLSTRGKFEDEDANGNFIAHAREDIPALISEVERLTKENTDAKARLDRFIEAGLNVGKENAVLKKALKESIRISLPNSSDSTIEAIFNNLIKETQEQEGK